MRRSWIGSVCLASLLILSSACDSAPTDLNRLPEQDGADMPNEKVVLWKWIPNGDQMRDLEISFEQQNPDIDLVVQHIGESEAYFQKLSVGLASGNGPDIIAMQVGANANKYKSFLEPLRPYAEKSWGPDWKSRFHKLALEQSAYSGEDYRVLPGGITITPLIFYNRSIFESLNLEEPRTYDELLHVISAIRKSDPALQNGIGIGGKEGWACRDIFMAIAGQIAPGKVYRAEQGLVPWTDPDLVESFRWWRQMFEDGIFDSQALERALYPYAYHDFNRGTLAMLSMGSWQLSVMTRQAVSGFYNPNRFGLFPLPQLTEGTRRTATATVDVAWAMNRDSKHKEAVWKFIEFMTTGEGQRVWSNSLQVLPSATGVQVDRKVMAGQMEEKALATVLDYYTERGIAGTRELTNSDVQQKLFEVLQALAAKGITPIEAAKQMQQVMDRGAPFKNTN